MDAATKNSFYASSVWGFSKTGFSMHVIGKPDISLINVGALVRPLRRHAVWSIYKARHGLMENREIWPRILSSSTWPPSNQRYQQRFLLWTMPPFRYIPRGHTWRLHANTTPKRLSTFPCFMLKPQCSRTDGHPSWVSTLSSRLHANTCRRTPP
jgi:hypothetical protein